MKLDFDGVTVLMESITEGQQTLSQQFMKAVSLEESSNEFASEEAEDCSSVDHRFNLTMTAFSNPYLSGIGAGVIEPSLEHKQSDSAPEYKWDSLS